MYRFTSRIQYLPIDFEFNIYQLILNSTGSTYDSIGGFGSNLVPILDYSVTGRGTSSDPYVWSASFEFTSSEVTTYNLPTSNQFMT